VPGVDGCASPYEPSTAITVMTVAMAASRDDGSHPPPAVRSPSVRAKARRTQPGRARLVAVGCPMLTLRRVRRIGVAHQRRAMYSPGGMPTHGEPPVRAGEVAGLATFARRVMTAGSGTLGQPVENHRSREAEGAPMQAVKARGQRSARWAGR
jgi:hypothetical protein